MRLGGLCCVVGGGGGGRGGCGSDGGGGLCVGVCMCVRVSVRLTGDWSLPLLLHVDEVPFYVGAAHH